MWFLRIRWLSIWKWRHFYSNIFFYMLFVTTSTYCRTWYTVYWNFTMLSVFRFRASWLAVYHLLVWHRTTSVTVENSNTFTRHCNTSISLNISSSRRVSGPVIAVTTATVLQAAGPSHNSIPSTGWAISLVSVLHTVQPCSVCTEGSFTEVKQQGYTDDPSTPSCVMVKNEWSCTCTPHKCLHILRDFTFTP